jgi:hypothetical protein
MTPVGYLMLAYTLGPASTILTYLGLMCIPGISSIAALILSLAVLTVIESVTFAAHAILKRLDQTPVRSKLQVVGRIGDHRSHHSI